MKLITICSIFLASIALCAGEPDYFPEGTFDSDGEFDRLIIKWHSNLLSAMKEPSLWEISKKSKNEIYRLLLCKASSKPVCIRIEINHSGDTLVYIKVLPSEYEYTSQVTLITDEIKCVSKNDVLLLLDKLAKASFWEIKPSDYPPVITLNGGSMIGILDGSKWIFEGIKNGKYQAFSVSNPTHHYFRADTIVELGKTFLSLADLKVDPLF